MRIVRRVADMQSWSDAQRVKRKTIALVPTMGELHDGHLSLVSEAKRRGDVVVVSIFVNPMQFNQGRDFRAYPRDEERDRRVLEDYASDVLFAPDAPEVYPDGYQTAVEVDGVSRPLCGAFRPGHFRGVATVVTKLFNMVKPHVAIFGEKDFQQCVVIKRMVKDLNLDVEIVTMPTIREADGLAMSSRNARLSPDERGTSLCLKRALDAAQTVVGRGERRASVILEALHGQLNGPKVRLEYASLCDVDTLDDVALIARPVVLAVAAWIGDVRLIDNCVLGLPDP